MRITQLWSTWPNRVTTVRLVGTVVIAALTLALATTGPSGRTQLVLALVALLCEALDGVDGWLARRLDQATDFGARYDMEVDAAMVMVLSFSLVVCGVAGWWVLLLGGWRYGYVLAAQVVPALRRTLPYRWSRKLVAAIVALTMISSLLLDLADLPPAVTTLMLFGALLLLSWSFVRDIVWQLRHGGRPATGQPVSRGVD